MASEITNKKPYQIAHAGLARTFQTIRLFRELTVLENVEVAAVSMGLFAKSSPQAGYRGAGGDRHLPLGRDAAPVCCPTVWSGAWKWPVPWQLSRSFLFLDEPAAGLNEDESDGAAPGAGCHPCTEEPGHADRRSRHASDHAPVPSAARAEFR